MKRNFWKMRTRYLYEYTQGNFLIVKELRPKEIKDNFSDFTKTVFLGHSCDGIDYLWKVNNGMYLQNYVRLKFKKYRIRNIVEKNGVIVFW